MSQVMKLRGALKKTFFGESFPKCENPSTPGFLWDLGKRKVKFLGKKGDFRGALVFFIMFMVNITRMIIKFIIISLIIMITNKP